MTPWPRAFSRSIRFRTSAVWATPSAAVGSSSMTISRVEEQRAGDGDGLALAARQRGDRLAHARDAGGELGEQRPGAHLHRHLVELPGVELVAEEEVRDHVEVLAEREVLVDGGDAELRARRSGRSSRPACRGSGSSPEVGACTPASTLTSVDLPAPLSPTRATTSPAWMSRSMSVSADTAPKFLQMPRRLRMSSPVGRRRRCEVSVMPARSPGWSREAARRRLAGRLGRLYLMPSAVQPSA